MTEATILVTVDTVSVSCNVPNFKDTYILLCTNLKIMCEVSVICICNFLIILYYYYIFCLIFLAVIILLLFYL